MDLLFSENGMQRMDEIVQPGLLCAFDFDGTLAPIVAQPEQVHLPRDIEQRLISLSRYAPVAIITGRAVQDTKKYLGFSPDFILGNHGIEGLPNWHSKAATYQAYCSAWETKLWKALQDPAISDQQIFIEDKRYSLSVHYRPTHGHGDIAKRLQEFFMQLSPVPRVVAGKNVFNLLPPNAMNKGSALVQLMSSHQFRSAIYVGDDVTDEDVFRLRRPDILSVRIENAADSAAEFFLRQYQDIKHLLDELIVRLRLQRTSSLASPSWGG